MESPDADDQTRAVQRHRPADTELGAIPAPVLPQEPRQAQGTQEEKCEEGVHAVPSITTREQGDVWNQMSMLNIVIYYIVLVDYNFKIVF